MASTQTHPSGSCQVSGPAGSEPGEDDERTREMEMDDGKEHVAKRKTDEGFRGDVLREMKMWGESRSVS